MITFTKLLAGQAQTKRDESPANSVELPFERRQRSRLHATVTAGPLAGASVGIDLLRGTILRHDQRLASADGFLLTVKAATEPLLAVHAPNPHTLAVMAYHLGNRHVPVQFFGSGLRLGRDPVLAEMIIGLGGAVEPIEGPFDPESGAYHATSHHHHDEHEHVPHHRDRQHSPRIHDLADEQ